MPDMVIHKFLDNIMYSPRTLSHKVDLREVLYENGVLTGQRFPNLRKQQEGGNPQKHQAHGASK